MLLLRGSGAGTLGVPLEGTLPLEDFLGRLLEQSLVPGRTEAQGRLANVILSWERTVSP